ncbi:hypothetical protein BH23PLA1_BH23PLA1_20550 [soil metagenome]
MAPAIARTDIRRLNPTAQVLENPRARAAAIVEPLRLTPGKIANACAQPMSRASSQVVVSRVLPPSRRRVVHKRIMAVIKKQVAGTRRLTNADSIQSPSSKATTTAGKVAMTPRTTAFRIEARR